MIVINNIFYLCIHVHAQTTSHACDRYKFQFIHLNKPKIKCLTINLLFIYPIRMLLTSTT